MRQQTPSVRIAYAPSPDDPVSDPEDCAAFQFATRAQESLLSSVEHHEALDVNIFCMEESFFENILACRNPDDAGGEVLLLVLISCSADGSIHRSLRKAIKRLGNQDEISQRAQPIHLGVALLGHARCDNSAKQMKQTIFGSGRRIEKALLTTSNDAFVSVQERLETQVELVGPEADFDHWWSAVIQQFQTPA